MKDREDQINEMATIIDNAIYQYSSNPLPPKRTMCQYIASDLIYRNYRKMDEVTLHIDLDDCTPEQINEIMEKFSKAAETPYVAVPNNNEEQIRKEVAEEIIQLMKQVQAMFYDKEYKAIQNLIAEKYGVEVNK